MKKIILSTGFILAALSAQAQTCEAVATLSEDFSDFTIGTTSLPQTCWSAIAGGYPHGVVYTDETTDPANKYAVYYGAGGNGAFSYLIGPEVSTFDGAHQLSFTTWKLAQGGTVPAGTVTIQVGTISNIADAATFTAFGDAIALSAEGAVTFDEIIIPSAPAGSHVAWKFSTPNQHNAVAIDDVMWEAVPAPACEAVTAIDEDFTDFVTGVALPFNCWSSIANGPMVYTGATGGSITFYAGTSPNTAAYLVSPEVSTFDGNHQLTFDARKSTGGVVTLQTGYLTDAADATTFMAVGDAITLTSDVAPYTVAYPELTTNAHIAFQYTGGSVHQAAVTDNVVWDEIPAVECAAVETFTEDFEEFLSTVTLPFNCWSSIAGTLPAGPAVYTSTGTTGNLIKYYASTSNTTPAYLITPEVSTIDGLHRLTFNATLTSTAGATIQVGYITDAADAATFTAVGEPIFLGTPNFTTFNISTFAAITGNAHLAFRITSAAPHQALEIDNVIWEAIPAGTDSFAINGFALYPNPANGNVNIATKGNAGVVSIYSTTGNRVFETAVNSNSQSINIGALSAGLYIVRYTSGTTVATQKLIVR